MKNWLGKPKLFWQSTGVSLTELLMALVIAAIVSAGVYQMMRWMVRRSTSNMRIEQNDQTINRFEALITKDLEKAGSDPTGEALLGYILEASCAGLILFKYGIDPEPADPTCAVPLGEIGILSYLAYDDNGDGVVDPEEGIDLVTVPAALRPGQGDYVVYEFFDSDGDTEKDAIKRKDLGDPDSTADDLEETVLKNVVDFQIDYYGTDDSGNYGEIATSTRYDDIREVEVFVMTHASNIEPGYSNPDLPSSSPWKAYRTSTARFRVPLLVRKE